MQTLRLIRVLRNSPRGLASTFLYVASAALAVANPVSFICDAGDASRNVPCRVSLVPRDYTLRVQTIESDKVTELPPGLYDLRASADGLALATNTTLRIVPEPSPPRRIRLTLAPGGWIRLESGFVPSGGAVQILSLATGRLDTVFIDRESQLPFPAGKIVATALAGQERFVGVTSPHIVIAGKEERLERVHLSKPGTTDVILKIAYGDVTPAPARHDVELSISKDAPPLHPEATSNAVDHYSFFYDVPKGRYRVDLKSRYWWTPEATVDVVSAPVALDSGIQLRARPSLTIRVTEGQESAAAGFHYSLFECSDGVFGPGTAATPDPTKCRVLTSGNASGKARVDFLAPRWYFVVTERDAFRAARQVDMRDGVDADLAVDFRETRLTGHVRSRSEPVSAELTAVGEEEGKHVATGEAGADGAYALVLPAEETFRLTVMPPGVSERDAAVFRVSTHGLSMESDFDIPATKAFVVVTDAETQAPLEGARVTFVRAGGSEDRETDPLGKAALPLLPKGETRIDVAADGYRGETVTTQLAETEEAQLIPVHLRRTLPENSVRIHLPSGAAPPRSEVFVFASGGAVLEKEMCDADGLCQLANSPPQGALILGAGVEGGMTIEAADLALTAGDLTLRPAGGVLRVAVSRGPQSKDQVFRLGIMLEGVTIPEGIVASVANLLLSAYRLYLPRGMSQVLEVPGLPAGTSAIALDQVLADGRSTWSTGAIPISLPGPDAVPVSVP
jgi:hypothetical protein